MNVAVLLGGDSPERDVSLASGKSIVEALRSRGHEAWPFDPAMPPGGPAEPVEVDIGEEPPDEAPSGVGMLELFCSPSIRRADVVFVALHGGMGEDGTIQAILEAAGVPYTGTGVLGSALAMNKDRSKAVFRASGVQTAPYLLVTEEEAPEAGALTDRIASEIGYPVVIKPNGSGSSVGFSYVQEAGNLAEALEKAFRFDDDLIVEKCIPGREITAAMMDGTELPLIEIVPEGGFYSYKCKYTKGASRYIVSPDLDEEIASRIKECAGVAYRSLLCRDYARVDFRLDPEGEPFCLEVNTLPGMTELSLVPMAAAGAGISFEELIEAICKMAAARGSLGSGD